MKDGLPVCRRRKKTTKRIKIRRKVLQDKMTTHNSQKEKKKRCISLGEVDF
jgi:hypothetical protein